MMDEKRTMIEQASAIAEILFNKNGELRPMYDAAIGEKRVIFAMPRAESKDVAIAMVRAYFQHAKPSAYVFMSEAWMTIGHRTAEEKERIAREGLSEHPDRTESLWFIAEDKFGVLQAVRAIDRDGGTAKLGPLEFLPDTVAEGRMIGLLPQEGAAH
jgi:hypothetical protein